MSFDLYSRKGSHFRTVGWTCLLDTGAGVILHTTKGVEPGQCVWFNDRKGRNVNNNCGCYVDKKNAMDFSRYVSKLVKLERLRRNMFDDLPEDHFMRNLKISDRLFGAYSPIRADFIDNWEQLASWINENGGFYVR
jgi:hypothetical protein